MQRRTLICMRVIGTNVLCTLLQFMMCLMRKRQPNDHTANLLIAIRKTDLGINGNHLFSERKPSHAGKLVEDILSNSCGPLTVGQHTGVFYRHDNPFICSNNENHLKIHLNLLCKLSQELLELLWMKGLYQQMN